ncbi:MAG: GGDEF and EAL domain-containing protein [Lachnospiraceae bacterium]|nr:GGDEF and EAL domain-containing protein [Lachnospiraceae bacterium]
MDKSADRVTAEQFRDIIELLNSSMDDYLYVYDYLQDTFSISSSALERFNISTNPFNNVLRELEKFVYPEDYPLLAEDLRALRFGQKEIHDMEYRWLDKKGDTVWINCRGRVLKDENGKAELLVGCINEIGRQQTADNVSGLMGELRLRQVTQAHGVERMKGYMLRLGIDNFKEINENRGMDYGDMILRKTAECIEAVIEPRQKLFRIVADEFMLIDFDANGARDAKRLYKKIRSTIDAFIESNFYEVFYTTSAGILNLEEIADQSYSNLMKLSEFALNEAKIRGRNRCYVFDQRDYDSFCRKRKIIQIMRKAVNDGCKGFEVYFQPIVDINANRIASAETLLRFYSEELGSISPAEFIPLLEESGLIIPVGKWVLHQAMRACSELQKTIPDFRISVNLSYIQVLKSNVMAEILVGVEKYRLRPGSIVIELTESGFLESNESFIKFCEGLRESGVLLALDDFGTGYSNFHYLYNLNPDSIKIDRGFTFKALHNDYEKNLLRHMIDMVHSIDLKLCIEGIETQEEFSKICEIEPDYIQGFYFGRPCPFEQFRWQYVNNQ